VDETDHHREILDRIDGMDGAVARERLDLDAEEPPALAYWVAAIRETFEETGVLPATGMDPAGLSTLQEARRRLLAGESSFQEILEEIGLRLDASALAYVGHWITPECEPRRYQTRFFLTTTNGEMPVLPHQEEMVDHLWLSPKQALVRNRNGSLPLVLPTLVTLEELAAFSTAKEAVSRLGALPVSRRLPVPSRTEGGFRFALPR
jgi:8-oxo-dGTP pyrophosphatase MutT (NUDIX family)